MTKIDQSDVGVWSEYASLDINNDHSIDVYELAQAVETDIDTGNLLVLDDTLKQSVESQSCGELPITMPKTQVVLRLMEEVSRSKSEQIQKLGRLWAQTPELRSSFVKLKMAESALGEAIPGLHSAIHGNDESNGEFHRGYHDDIDFINQKLGLTPTDPLYFTCTPSMDFYLITKGSQSTQPKAEDFGNQESDLLLEYSSSTAGHYSGFNSSQIGQAYESITMHSYFGTHPGRTRRHEVAHAIFFEPSFRHFSFDSGAIAHFTNYPLNRWIYEGLAEWMSESGSERVSDVRYFENVVLKGGMKSLKFSDQWRDALGLGDVSGSYVNGYLAILYLEQNYGIEAVQEFTKHLMMSYSFEEALLKSCNLTTDKFYEDELEWRKAFVETVHPYLFDERFKDALTKYFAAYDDNKYLIDMDKILADTKTVEDLIALVESYPGYPLSQQISGLLMHTDTLRNFTPNVYVAPLLENFVSRAATAEYFTEVKKQAEQYWENYRRLLCMTDLSGDYDAYLHGERYLQKYLSILYKAVKLDTNNLIKDLPALHKMSLESLALPVNSSFKHFLFISPVISHQYREIDKSLIPDFQSDRSSNVLAQAIGLAADLQLITDDEFVEIVTWYLEYVPVESFFNSMQYRSSEESTPLRNQLTKILSQNSGLAIELSRQLLKTYSIATRQQEFSNQITTWKAEEQSVIQTEKKFNKPSPTHFTSHQYQDKYVTWNFLTTIASLLSKSEDPQDQLRAQELVSWLVMSSSYLDDSSNMKYPINPNARIDALVLLKKNQILQTAPANPFEMETIISDSFHPSIIKSSPVIEEWLSEIRISHLKFIDAKIETNPAESDQLMEAYFGILKKIDFSDKEAVLMVESTARTLLVSVSNQDKFMENYRRYQPTIDLLESESAFCLYSVEGMQLIKNETLRKKTISNYLSYLASDKTNIKPVQQERVRALAQYTQKSIHPTLYDKIMGKMSGSP